MDEPSSRVTVCSTVPRHGWDGDSRSATVACHVGRRPVPTPGVVRTGGPSDRDLLSPHPAKNPETAPPPARYISPYAGYCGPRKS